MINIYHTIDIAQCIYIYMYMQAWLHTRACIYEQLYLCTHIQTDHSMYVYIIYIYMHTYIGNIYDIYIYTCAHADLSTHLH